MPSDHFNSMQANLGVLPGMGLAPQMQTPTPGETSVRLMEQARQQQMSMQMASMSVSQQFQQRLQVIQQQQSMSPLAAQMMSQHMPWAAQYQGGMLPSPLTMTPPSTGVFRPPPPQVMQPIPPMYTPPLVQTPFTPQLPEPMFQTQYEQHTRAASQQRDRMFSVASQIPYGAGTALGVAGGAYAGSRLGGAIGGNMGRLIGAAGGALLAGGSGFAQGLGNIVQAPFQPMIENQQMSAAMQRMSKDWVVTGAQLSPLGQGLSRGASQRLVQGLRDTAADRGFQRETGGMFNREDMMRMTGLAGQAGLLDMSQSVPQIQSKMREVAKTVKEFMQLTNDPDVTNVIREMGRLQQFGLNPQQMQQAAANMKMFSRAAGTSIQGLQQMGGLPGAMTYQQAGLTAGQGFEYGNYSAAMARQAVASGTYSPQQLALMGGVQGVAQRNTQAQAAFMTMPLMGAAFGQYGAGGWGLNQGAAAGAGGMQGGAFGLVNQAVGSMNQAVRQGGIGALAMFPLQQREVQDKLAAELTPQQQTAMRFQMAMQTGQRLGMRGMSGFAAGARSLYGDDVAQQMMYEARNPEFWQSQRDMVRRRRTELAMEQRAQNKANAYGATDELTRPFRTAGRNVGDFFGGIGKGISDVGKSIGNFIEDRKAYNEGIIVNRTDPRFIASGQRGRAATTAAFNTGVLNNIGKGEWGQVDWSNETVRQGVDFGNLNSGANTAANISGTIGKGALSVAGPIGAGLSIASTLVEGATGVDLIREAQGGLLSATMDSQEEAGTVLGAAKQSRRWSSTFNRAKATGKAAQKLRQDALDAAGKYTNLGENLEAETKTWGKKSVSEWSQKERDANASAMSNAAASLTRTLRRRSGIAGIFGKERLEPADIEQALKSSMGLVKWDKIPQSRKDTMIASTLQEAKDLGGPSLAAAFDDSQEQLAKVGKLAVKDAIEHLRGGVTAAVDAAETKMDLTGDIGGVSIFEKTGTPEFRSVVNRGAAAEDIAMLTLQLAKGQDISGADLQKIRKEEEQLKKQLVGKGKKFKTEEEFYERMRDVSGMKESVAGKGGWTENLETRMLGLRGEGATATDIMSGVTKMQAGAGFETRVAGLQAMGFEGAILSAAAGGRKDAKGVGGLSDVDIAAWAKGAGKEDIARMKEEGGMGRKYALLAERAGKGDAKAQKLLGKLVDRMGTPQEKTETPLVEAGGEEAEKLKASDEALSQMQAAFSNFTPAVDEFAAGAKALREAMESEWMNRNREG